MKTNSGQTLIEVIVAVGLVVLVLTTLASGLALGIRNNRYARDSATAQSYVRESLEWLRNMRDSQGWESFYRIIRNDGTTVTYCLDTLPASADALNNKTSSACTTQTIDGTFKRQTVLTVVSATEIDATTTVSWIDGSKTFTSTSMLKLYDHP